MTTPTVETGNVLSLDQQSSVNAAGWSANGTNTEHSWDSGSAYDGTHSVRLAAIAAGTVQSKTGYPAVKNVVGGSSYRFRAYFRASTTSRPVRVIVNWVDSAGTLISPQVSAAMGQVSAVGTWQELQTEALTVPANATQAELVITIENCVAGEAHRHDLRYFGSTTTADPANAGPDQTVDAGATVTLTGTPDGGTWTQATGDAVTLSAPTTTTTSTSVTFSASNPSTTTTNVRSFTYTGADSASGSDDVTVTASAATAGETVLFNEGFSGTSGTAWPTGWTVTASAGAAVSGATQESGDGRMTLPGSAGYPGIAAHRRDFDVADVDIAFEVRGPYDTTSAATSEHYREVHVRVPLNADVATRLADAYKLSITPNTTLGGPWRAVIQRRRNGITSNLTAFDLSVASSVPLMKGRFKAVGQTLQAKVWDAAVAEPAAWNLTAVDDSADAILTSGNIALAAFGSGVTNTGLYVEWDNVKATVGTAPPAITVTAEPFSIWPDPISLAVTGSGYDRVEWSVVSAPAGTVGAFDDPAATTAVYRPGTAGDFVFRVTASNYATSTSVDVPVEVTAQLWMRTASGKVPVVINVWTPPPAGLVQATVQLAAAASLTAGSTILTTASVENGYGTYTDTARPSSLWRPYADDAPWNRRLPASPPVRADSATIVAQMFAETGVTSTVANMHKDNGYYHPIYQSQSGDPLWTYRLATGGYTGGTADAPASHDLVDGETFRLNAAAAAPPATNDGHLTVFDWAAELEYTFHDATLDAATRTLTAKASAKVPIRGQGRGANVTAGEFPVAAGIIRYQELAEQRIDHALFAIVYNVDGTSVYPATGVHGRTSATALVEMGAHLWLDMTEAEIEALAVGRWKKTVAHALREYGAFVGDTGGSSGVGFQVENELSYTALGQADPFIDYVQSGAAGTDASFNPAGSTSWIFNLKDTIPWTERLRVLTPPQNLGF